MTNQAPLGRIVGVIPARLASTRLPGKVLRPIGGEPLLAWVYRAAKACALLDEVVVATDSAEVLALCDGTRTVADIGAELGTKYNADVTMDVAAYLAKLVERELVHDAQ